MSDVFLDYAKYYDALYKDKNYESEVEFIIGEIKRYAPNAKSILNLGCGTGRHDYFLAERGFVVTGIDLSKEMINIAQKSNKNPNCNFLIGDGRDLNLDKKFDVVISLFHVLSYQTSNQDVVNFLKTASKNLSDNGICLMDYWYGPAVLNIKPDKRTKSFETSEMKVIRNAETTLDYTSNIATVHFDIEINDLKNGTIQKLHEDHPMRYFFTPEIHLLSELASLSHIHHAQWMESKMKPSEKSWAAYSVFKK